MSELGDSFAAVLIGDVIAAAERRQSDDSQVNRRHLVRSTFAAIEGLVWLAREHLLQSDDTLEDMPPLARMALREASYQIDGHGRLTEQLRYIPLPTMVRFLVQQAKAFDPSFVVDFSSVGWLRFKTAVAIRNRATHPKSAIDLAITDVDLKTVNEGFLWTLETCESVMRSANAALTKFGDLYT